MRKRWQIGAPDIRKAELLARQGGITQLCAEILVSRGIETIEAAQQALNVSELTDPFCCAIWIRPSSGSLLLWTAASASVSTETMTATA